MSELVKKNSKSQRRMRQMIKAPWKNTTDSRPWFSGKGDKQRPMAISTEEYQDNWEAIFGNKEAIEEDKETQDEI